MNLMAKSNNRLLIHTHMDPVTLKNSVDIILTPQFYTFLREDLDLKFSYQAKQIAPSLFDDYLDRGKEYQYYVYKCESQWCFIAYNIEEIDSFLESKGIEKHRVSKIFFAQQLAEELENPIELSANSALHTIDGIVTLLPKNLMDSGAEYSRVNFNESRLKGGVTMGASLNSFVSLKETVILSSLFFLLGSTFIFEGYRIKSSVESDNEKLIELLSENSAFSNSRVRASLLEQYRPIDTLERQKRESIQSISKLLSAQSQLKKLTLKDKKIEATLSIDDDIVTQQVKEHAEAKQFTVSGSGKSLNVEKKL